MSALVLDRQSVVPLYYQIRERLLEQIRSGELKAGDPVPSEQDLAARLGISRMTARQALKSLCSLGVAYSQRGKGTFVSRTKLEKDFRSVYSFSEEMRARGAAPRSKVLAFRQTAPDPDVAEALLLEDGEEVFLLRRLRLADAVPLSVECTHLPAKLFPGLMTKFDPSGSLYQALAENYSVTIHSADEVAEAAAANAEECKLLRIRAKAPVFRFTRTAYLHDGRPVEYVRSTYRGDRCKVVNRLTRQLEIVS